MYRLNTKLLWTISTANFYNLWQYLTIQLANNEIRIKIKEKQNNSDRDCYFYFTVTFLCVLTYYVFVVKTPVGILNHPKSTLNTVLKLNVLSLNSSFNYIEKHQFSLIVSVQIYSFVLWQHKRKAYS